MRLDRIDAVAAGRVVLDYKSGRPADPGLVRRAPHAPAAARLSGALGSEVVALATVHLTAREVRFSGVVAASARRTAEA